VTASGPRGAIVIDTDVFSADLVPTSRLAERYAPIITGRPAFISFQTAAELRYGAIRRGWGEARMLKLDSKIQRAGSSTLAPNSWRYAPSCAPTAPRSGTHSHSGNPAHLRRRRPADVRQRGWRPLC
jgi:hypothetical protein